MSPSFYFLGVRFWNGRSDDLIREMDRAGGMLAVPSAPSLAQMSEDVLLEKAYQSADWSVMDGGYVALVLRLLGKSVVRISGLQLIEKLVAAAEDSPIPFRARKVLWVVPSEAEKERIAKYLAAEGFDASLQDYYLAPFYRSDSEFQDKVLIQKADESRPDWIILCLGGGRQEKLGYFIRTSNVERPTSNIEEREGGEGTSNIEHSTSDVEGKRKNGPVILCTGAAIAFFTGGQAKIPTWADRLYLGWFLRIMENPGSFIPRYFKAAWHFPIAMWRYRGKWFVKPVSHDGH
jgi:N-acetylglucosaminyldiphosphoundecaprenol N-acetyl-beta-D-mannosaminyltransferase